MPPHSEQIVSRICGALFRGSLGLDCSPDQEYIFLLHRKNIRPSGQRTPYRQMCLLAPTPG
ncbi:hypothetical protein BVV10_21730 [Xanthomonas oryzae pv. oryzae]|nr:hypothetical protein BVV16_21730 [Xanthomonas oryzae pv. oryzae]AUI95790.1 hypothetical protein BVV17_21765 [Xanthomonas oryzae pv. oryzae]AUI99465.1 hypothetical protein BVV18_21770 [Xanthomonas oryzae pv. oryzae]AUJ03140.1 hypothetical protein BVV10_21730 [Xanthomonas oryzae pv. oryzae]AUJ06805.1 hypothetical protein BVV19_21810 [Xanthomonas oryzae pv. oryzae]